MRRIELVYFSGCPHVAAARAHLREALAAVGRGEGWIEFDLDSAEVPDRVRALPSPTILVDGKEVGGEAPPGSGRSCRMAGAPGVPDIVRALGSEK